MTSDSDQAKWRIGSYCDSSACVEVGYAGDEIYVRRAGSDAPVVVFTRDEWTAFLRSAKDGEFDL